MTNFVAAQFPVLDTMGKFWFLIVVLDMFRMLPATAAILAEDTATILDPDIPGRQNDKFSNAIYPYLRDRNSDGLPVGAQGDDPGERIAGDLGRRCATRLESALDDIRRRQASRERTAETRQGGGSGAGGGGSPSHLHLDGYSLHQPMRSAPFDMYVTDMRVRLPSSNSWVRVDTCRYDPRNTSLQTRISFNDLTISGKVNLLNDNDALLRRDGDNDHDREDRRSRNACNMILRLRRAGIGFHTEPIRLERGQFNVRTDSHFLEPGFISVYAYGCEPHYASNRRAYAPPPPPYRNRADRLTRRQWRHPGDYPDSGGGGDDLAQEADVDEDISREMEDIFLKGIRSLLTNYMQKELQPAIKETLMTNMGYTVSYG